MTPSIDLDDASAQSARRAVADQRHAIWQRIDNMSSTTGTCKCSLGRVRSRWFTLRRRMPLRAEDIHDFYEECYSAGPQSAKWSNWRELGAVTKANHIATLIERGAIQAPNVVLEVGCGDGAVLRELGRRKIGGTRIGLDISSSAVRLASARAEIARARVFDGRHISAADGEYDLAVATHVLEHVPEPDMLLREVLRVARAAIIEVPLERNVSARRRTARAASEAAGHLHRFTAGNIRGMIAGAGWRVQSEIFDPLPPAVHTFGRETFAEKATGYAKWAIRAALAASPALGQRIITLHYAVIAIPGFRRSPTELRGPQGDPAQPPRP